MSYFRATLAKTNLKEKKKMAQFKYTIVGGEPMPAFQDKKPKGASSKRTKLSDLITNEGIKFIVSSLYRTNF